MSTYRLTLRQFRSALADPETGTVRLELSNWYEPEGPSAPGMSLPPHHMTTHAVSGVEAMNFALSIAAEVDRLRRPEVGDYVEHELAGLLRLQEGCLTAIEAAYPPGTAQHDTYANPRRRLVGLLREMLDAYRGAPADPLPSWARLSSKTGA